MPNPTIRCGLNTARDMARSVSQIDVLIMPPLEMPNEALQKGFISETGPTGHEVLVVSSRPVCANLDVPL